MPLARAGAEHAHCIQRLIHIVCVSEESGVHHGARDALLRTKSASGITLVNSHFRHAMHRQALPCPSCRNGPFKAASAGSNTVGDAD